ncbi:hypothetical protein BGZ68_010288, partial [Mortierella alpina]
ALCKLANLKYPISGNATHDAFHRQFSGPDSFYVVFSGSEKLSPPDWYHAGQCLYVFPFHISNPGKLSLDITHLYDNFGAVVEQADEWPILKNQQVITDVPIEICRGCPSRVAEPRFLLLDNPPLDAIEDGSTSQPENRNQPYSHDKPLSDKRTKDASPLPLCSRDIAVQGAWLPAHPHDKQSWRRSNYTWTPLGCTFEKPLDSSCLTRRKTALKILFQGDTHLRVALESMLRRLNGTNIRQTSTMTSDDRLETTFGTTTLAYIHDPLISHRGERSDVLVANMGHWATGTRFLDQLWSTTKYHDSLRDLIDGIQQRARDQQDLEDEDLDPTAELSEEGIGGEAEYDGGHDDEEEEDEDELEFERENLRQKKLKEKEIEELEVFWDDETEDAEIGSKPKVHPSPEEKARQEELDYLTDKYHVEDRVRAEDESNRFGGRRKDAVEGARPRYPHHRILRQSKHLVALDRAAGRQESEHEELRDDLADEQTSDRVQPKNRPSVPKSPVSSSEDSRPARSTSGGAIRDRAKTSSGQDRIHEVSGARGQDDKKPTFHSGGSASKDNLVKEDGSRARRARRPLYRNYIYKHPREGPVGRISVDSNRLVRRLHEDRDLDLHSQSSPLKIAWFGMVAYPETQAAGGDLIHDWRTIYRLRYWNQIAEDVMLLHGVHFMDFFSMTLSMLDTSPDRGHYFGTDASEAMLEELSFKLGLCNDDGEELD